MKPRIPDNCGRLGKYGLALLGVFLIAIGLVSLLAPRVNSPVTDTLPFTCIYKVKVFVFEDSNGNAVLDSGEPGIGGIQVSLQHSLPVKNAMPEQTSTDSAGVATLDQDNYCVVHDTLTTTVMLPSGYHATTPLSFGPYPVPESSDESATQVAQHPIPHLMYVGFHRN